MLHKKFSVIRKTLADFIYEKEGNIPRSTMLAVGTMVLLLSVFYADDVFAAHRSHTSHSSHKSHTSHVSNIKKHSSHDSVGGSDTGGIGAIGVVPAVHLFREK